MKVAALVLGFSWETAAACLQADARSRAQARARSFSSLRCGLSESPLRPLCQVYMVVQGASESTEGPGAFSSRCSSVLVFEQRASGEATKKLLGMPDSQEAGSKTCSCKRIMPSATILLILLFILPGRGSKHSLWPWRFCPAVICKGGTCTCCPSQSPNRRRTTNPKQFGTESVPVRTFEIRSRNQWPRKRQRSCGMKMHEAFRFEQTFQSADGHGPFMPCRTLHRFAPLRCQGGVDVIFDLKSC